MQATSDAASRDRSRGRGRALLARAHRGKCGTLPGFRTRSAAWARASSARRSLSREVRNPPRVPQSIGRAPAKVIFERRLSPVASFRPQRVSVVRLRCFNELEDVALAIALAPVLAKAEPWEERFKSFDHGLDGGIIPG